MKKNKPPKEIKMARKTSQTKSKAKNKTVVIKRAVQNTTNDPKKKKGLTSNERLNLMLILGGLIAIVTIAINFAVKYFGLDYTKWTITVGVITVLVMDLVAYIRMKDNMVNRRSRNAILYANIFAFVISVVLSSIYIAHNDNAYLVVSGIFSQMNFSFSEINGKFFMDIMRIARLIPMINMGHMYVVIVEIIFCIFRKLLN